MHFPSGHHVFLWGAELDCGLSGDQRFRQKQRGFRWRTSSDLLHCPGALCGAAGSSKTAPERQHLLGEPPPELSEPQEHGDRLGTYRQVNQV